MSAKLSFSINRNLLVLDVFFGGVERCGFREHRIVAGAETGFLRSRVESNLRWKFLERRLSVCKPRSRVMWWWLIDRP